MAANRFHVLDPIAQMTRKIYNLSVPSLAESFDINPIAAMPSLHAAFPMLLVLACFHHFGRRWGLLLSAYLAAVVFGIVYMGEHYVVDIVAGFALALSGHFVAHHSRRVSRWLEQRRMPSLPPAGPGARKALQWPLLLCVLLIALAQAAGSAAKAMQGREVPTEDFIARELDGKSPTMARYYRALNAYYAHDYRRAQPLFAKARFEVPELAKQERAGLLFGESAYHNRDYAGAVAALGTKPKLSPEQGLMLAESRLALGQREQGFQVLDFLARSLPDDHALQARKRELEQRFARER
jgi:hypothetical protein